MAYPAEARILATIKAALGLTADYTPFDVELLMHINSAVSDLMQLGVGPATGLGVEVDTPWSSLIRADENLNLENVKSYIFIKTKLVFDSASMGAHHISAFERVLAETEWRINHAANPPEENMPPVISVQEV